MLAEIDYSQIEPRLIAEYIHRTVHPYNPLMQVYLDGRDLYKVTAAALLDKPYEEVTKTERKHAKPVALGFQYGMHADTFIATALKNYRIQFTRAEAERARNVYFGLWEGLEDWHEYQRQLVKQHGYVENLFGRRRRLPAIGHSDHEKVMEAERQAINSPIQATASDILMCALGRMPELEQTKMSLTVHDSLIVDTTPEQAELMLDGELGVIARTLIDLEPLAALDVHLTVPLAVEVEVGGVWTEWTNSVILSNKEEDHG